MRIFITGATGFIGRHVATRLSQSGHELQCLVRPTSDVSHLKNGATLVTGDVTDRDSVRAGMQGCQWVINLANIFSFWEAAPQVFEDVNITGTRNVMECALEAGVSKVVHVSTVCVYGKPAEIPYTETSPAGLIRFSRYAQTKYEGDAIAWDLQEKRGLPLVMVYPGSVLGRGDNKASGQYIRNLIQRRLPATIFLDSALTFVHVKDVAEAIVKAIEKEGNVGERYFAGGQPLTLREFNTLVSELSGVRPPVLTLPGWLVMMNATLLTGIANLIKRPPPWGMSVDQMKTMQQGFVVDGGKTARELGITYTLVRVAIEEAIASYRESPKVPRSK